MKKHKKAVLFGALLLVLVATVIFSILILTKKIRIAVLLADKYSVHGVDVSHYQGRIDWRVLADNDISFAFIKATEGSSHIDENFMENWEAAAKTKLITGSYHFFSFDSPGKEQADWFIQNVGTLSGHLAPVVDIEFYGDRETNPPEPEKVQRNLQEMLEALEKQYQIRPVIYTTYACYQKYIQGFFSDYPLWIRNVYYSPDWDLGSGWQFWQYTDRAELEGYSGQEQYIDKNVFSGSQAELEKFICPKSP